MIATPSELSQKELYNILISAVAPRPIAWVSTIGAAGAPNLAPFSFFNVVCADPPLLGFSPARRNSCDKDTLRNIRETKEFVVNLVTYDLAEAMNLTSGDYDPTIDEFQLAKLTPAQSEKVRPPRVAESPVSFECQLHQILEFSPKPTSGSLVIGEIVALHIANANLKDGRLDRDSLDLIGRMGGLQYARTTQRFEMIRPKVE